MKKIALIILAFTCSLMGAAQSYNLDSMLRVIKKEKDSTLRATLHADSVKIDKQFAESEKWAKMQSIVKYPVFSSNEFGGVIPVDNITEVPDPNMEYKLLFELVTNNPDSVAKEVNYSLVEVSRIINLHVAAGIPLKKIMPVIVVHAGALKAFTTNDYYQAHKKIDNPNLKLIDELKGIGTRFIACGQAMAFLDVKKEELLPLVKVSLTAQTVLSSYQLKGYVWYNLDFDKK